MQENQCTKLYEVKYRARWIHFSVEQRQARDGDTYTIKKSVNIEKWGHCERLVIARSEEEAAELIKNQSTRSKPPKRWRQRFSSSVEEAIEIQKIIRIA